MHYIIRVENPHMVLMFETFEKAKYVMSALIEVYGTDNQTLEDSNHNII